MTQIRTSDNPHDICTWRPLGGCADCSLSGRLKCRFSAGDLAHFISLFATFAIPAFIGMITAGYGGYLLGWALFWVLFFGFWEIRILCSHCPFYAKEGSTLECIANYGCPKFWKYRPGPMNWFEKGQLMVGFLILVGYPFPFMLHGGQYLMVFLAAWGGLIFFWTLSKYTCTACVNFSCPLNRVPKHIVDEYLLKNQVMRDAWEASGYKIDQN